MVHKIMPRKLRGFTLTEAAIVLGIVGLILGAIWVAASAVYTNMRVQTTTTQLLQMAQAIRSIHATQQTIGAGASALILAQAGGVPKDMLDDPDAPTTVSNVWGGDVTVVASDVMGTGVAGESFLVTYEEVPREACSDLLTRLTGPGRDGGLVGAGVGLAFDAANGDFPVGIAGGVGNCADPNDNDLQFEFRLRG